MNRSNVWSLADQGDANGLENAIQLTPTCVNVCGWSYATGKRRGVGRSSDGRWVITSHGTPHPASVLHYAAIRNSVDCIVLALSAGANVDVTLGGDEPVKADDIADALGNDEIADVLRAARKRQGDPLGVCEEDEGAIRRRLEVQESCAREKLARPFLDGIVEVVVHFRDGGVQLHRVVPVPRYIEYQTFLSKLQGEFEQRLLLSYKREQAITKSQRTSSMLETASNNSRSRPGSAMSGNHGASAMNDTSMQSQNQSLSRSSKKQKGAAAEINVELEKKTLPAFLNQDNPVCIARPLVPCSTPPHLLQESIQQQQEALRNASPVRLNPQSNNQQQKSRTNTPQSDANLDPGTQEGSGTDRSHLRGWSANKRPSESQQQQRPDENGRATPSSTMNDKSVASVQQSMAVVEERKREVENLIGSLARVEHGPQRLETMRKLIDEAEAVTIARGTTKGRPFKKLTDGERNHSIERLYERPLSKILSRNTEIDRDVAEGQRKLFSPTKKFGTELTMEEQELVERVYDRAVSHKENVIAAIEERVMENAPRPKDVELDEDEAEAARIRLTQSSTRRARAMQQLDEKYYGSYDREKHRKVQNMEAHLASVYTGAVQKKIDKRSKLEKQVGDFRTQKKAKKLSPDELKAMGDRLSTKH